ncbi:MAG: hypothetical protein D6B25_04025 [Desulfobulbaceae bacterium]|nr:MAG: hypothetical protein D6B25_04025 [Desulfobulbaceae bacterium]
MSGKKQYFFDKPKNVKLVLYSLYASCGVLLVVDFVVHRHIIHQWEQLLGFYSIYGFIGCTAIVLGSKWLRSIVEREEDYYDKDELTQNSGDDDVA